MEEIPSPITVLLSGGLDSMACAHFLAQKGFEIRATFVDYGQPAKAREAQAAHALTELFRIPLSRIELRGGPRRGPGEIMGRNAMLAFAALTSCDQPLSVSMGIHYGTPYYDCSEDFARRVDHLFQTCTNGLAHFVTPLIKWRKATIYEYCRQNRLPVDLTYSCEAADAPCGICASCKDRIHLNAL